MLHLLRQRSYSLLWWSALVSGIGNYVLIAALPYYVYATSGSTLASGITFVSEMLPMLLCSSVGGIYADRWKRKRVLVFSDWLRGIILLPMLAVHSTSTLWIVYATAFLGAAVANFVGPFGNAAIPHVVKEHELPAANAAFSVGGYLAVLLGTTLGGILLQQIGLRGVVLVDGLTFVVSGLLVARIDVNLEQRSIEAALSAGTQDAGRAWREWLLGVRFILGERWLTVVFMVTMFVFLGNSIVVVVLAPYVRHTLGGSAQVYAWILAVQGLGGIMAGLAIERVSARIPPAPLLSASLFTLGLLTIAIAAIATIPATVVVMFLAGFSILFGVASLNTLLQAHVPDHLRGRVSGVFLSTVALMSLLGSLTASFSADAIGIRVMLGLGGALYMAGATVGLVVLTPTMRRASFVKASTAPVSTRG
jgi:MFS family permease